MVLLAACGVTGRAGIAVADQTAIGFVGNVPESNAGFRKQVRDRHKGGADNSESVLDAVHLQNLHKGFFSCHFHFGFPYICDLTLKVLIMI